MAHKKTSEPLWWALFSAGGMLAALLIPAHVFLHGIALPLGWAPLGTVERLSNGLELPLVRLYVFVLISLPLYHWAHRFRFMLFDLGIKGFRTPIAALCYGAAIVGTIIAAVVLLRIG